MRESKNIPVMVSTNDDYVRPTVVALTSMFENANSNTFYQVTVLIPGNFMSENKGIIDLLSLKFGSCKIDFIDMGEKYKDAPRSWSINAPTYYRLDAPSLFPGVKKCLFLEGDMIVRHDLSEMYDTNIDDYYIAGVSEGHYQNVKKIGILEIPDLKQYVNTGVSIMNLEKLRADRVEEKYSEFIKRKGKYIRKYIFLYGEQDVINSVCYGKILVLPMEFGLLINLQEFFADDMEKKDPTIVHFAGHDKPWRKIGFAASIFHTEFWSYARKTGLYSEDEIEMLRGSRQELNQSQRMHKKKLEEQKRRRKRKQMSSQRKNDF